MVFRSILLIIKLIVLPLSSVKKELLLLIFTMKKENQILHRSLDLKNKRPKIRFKDRVIYSIISQLSEKMRKHFTLIKPETVLKWTRQLTKRYWTYPSKKLGRPETAFEIKKEVICILFNPAFQPEDHPIWNNHESCQGVYSTADHQIQR